MAICYHPINPHPHSNRMFCVPTFFYTDCDISDLKRADVHGDVFTAQINGRTSKHLVMTNDIYHSLGASGSHTKSRVWFYAPGLNRKLIIAAVQNSTHRHSVLRNRSISSLYALTSRTLLAGLLAWFATWALLAIPVLSWYGANAPKGVLVLETLSIQIGTGVAALYLSYLLWVRAKMNRLDSWQPGDIAPYTRALKTKTQTAPQPHPSPVKVIAPELVD